ncbi:hypothetical protein I0C86_41260 [Plantactinospora sp. S1510]|uniref:Uncharacterized protein n=1 Tax=Plantactinospora alkalitolerans TaxID=2789879 RepID=A0ABS0HAZ4_9ACTN|nr:hypothetical protein [Plantactinospora alkalitolerans]MBF9135282.1 hypothetical protein [Plantactinospora alkalitolerans]
MTTDNSATRRVMAGDAVRLATPWRGGNMGVKVGAVGVIDGMLGKPIDQGSITFNASTYRDGRVVRCSGDPATIATVTAELRWTGETTEVTVWRFRNGMRRADNREEYTVTVPVWDWCPGV